MMALVRYPSRLRNYVEELRVTIRNELPDMRFDFVEPFMDRSGYSGENLWFLPVYVGDRYSLSLLDLVEPYLHAIVEREEKITGKRGFMQQSTSTKKIRSNLF